MRLMRRKMISIWNQVAEKDAKRIATQTPIAGVTALAGLPYLDDGHPLHRLNLYFPENATGPLPTIIDIHGGGWMYGDCELNRHYCMVLASQGFAVMAMSYRLLPEVDLQGMVADVFASLHWLARHGEEHHCDLSRVFLTGDSAGGHLTGLATCIQLSPELQRVYGVLPVDFAIRAIAISHGVCNVTDFGAGGLQGWLVAREMRQMLYGHLGKRAPWIGHASFHETAAGLKLPPVLVISSEPDGFFAQSQSLASCLQASGATYETKFWTRDRGERLGHVFPILFPDWPESMETNQQMITFFRRAVGE